jgi:hypothetical protein
MDTYTSVLLLRGWIGREGRDKKLRFQSQAPLYSISLGAVKLPCCKQVQSQRQATSKYRAGLVLMLRRSLKTGEVHGVNILRETREGKR